MIPPVITAQVVKSLMDSLVVPAINKFSEFVKKKYEISVVPIEKHFETYFSRAIDKLSIMSTLALKNEQLRLEDIYQPLTLITDRPKRESLKIDKFPYELTNKYGRILINDTAGMGKSTLSKFMFLKLAEDGIRIPFFIELRKLTKRHSLFDEIISLLNGIEEKTDRKLIMELLKIGGFCFILDGFDEISLSNRDEVVEDIKTFINTLSENNAFILTSRPEGLLSSFGDFKAFQIQPLKEPEAFSLLTKYDSDGETSGKLIKELKSKRNESVKEFLRNPLLVSLLFIVYDHKATIPLKKHLFYSQIYDALFESHDLSKGAQNIHVKQSGLDKDDFEKLLRFIGFQSFRTNKIQYTQDQLLKLIGEANKFWPSLHVKESDFLKDIITAVPLFTKDGLEYKWAHKSLSEYFAAKFIYLDQKSSDLLISAYNSNRLPQYINLLDLYYDLDVAGFKKYILLPLFKDYQKYLNQFEEESPDFFLRSLLFLTEVKFKMFDWNKLSVEVISEEFQNRDGRVTFSPMIKNKSEIGYVSSDASSVNNYGKRLILEKMYEKKVHSTKRYNASVFESEWLASLELNRYYPIDELIQLADGDGVRLADLCDLISEIDSSLQVYINKEDVVNEIRSISDEISAQSREFEL